MAIAWLRPPAARRPVNDGRRETLGLRHGDHPALRAAAPHAARPFFAPVGSTTSPAAATTSAEMPPWARPQFRVQTRAVAGLPSDAPPAGSCSRTRNTRGPDPPGVSNGICTVWLVTPALNVSTVGASAV